MSPQRLWMTQLGTQVRRLRTFLGLKQAELARAAGVSQCAISRIENAIGLATPYVVVAQVQRALAERLRVLPDDVSFTPEVRALLTSSSVVPEVVASAEPLVMSDPLLQEYVALFLGIDTALRPHLVAMMRAGVQALVAPRRSPREG